MSAELKPSPRQFSRRLFLRRGATVLGAAAIPGILAGCDLPFTSKPETPELPVEGPEEALQRLIEGNARYATGKSKPINESAERRDAVVKRQRPFAAVFSCVDSRVPPELVFDRGLGDLFVVRTAGEVVDSAVLGSLEYGAYELEIPLLVVMGHTKCESMKATIEAIKSGGRAEGSMGYLVEALAPAVIGGMSEMLALTSKTADAKGSGGARAGGDTAVADTSAEAKVAGTTTAEGDPTAQSAGDPAAVSETAAASGADTTAPTEADTTGAGDTTADTTADTTEADDASGEAVDSKSSELDRAIRRNVTLVIERITKSAVVAERIKKDRQLIVGAIYDIETGLVEFTDNVPDQFKANNPGSSDTTVAP